MAPRKKSKNKRPTNPQSQQSQSESLDIRGRSLLTLLLRGYQVFSKYFPVTTIDTLPDDILLEVFDQYRSVSGGNWPRLQGWYKLAHTCQRWRRLVFASSHRLNLQLRSTFGTRVADMVNHFPTFPLVLDYGPRLLKTWTPEDEDGLLFALQHLSRVDEIMLSAPQSTLAEMVAAMVDAAPMLEHLTLHSQSAEFVLPKSFLGGDAPQLRHLILTGVSLAALRPLLPSATSLVSLVLERISSSAYFPPDSLVAHIRAMPRLKTLSVGFLSAVPRPGFRTERFLPPGHVVRAELPALTQLIYRGVPAYIEALLVQIWTPLIRDVDITLFHQLTLRIPHIHAFINDLESFRPSRARIDFATTSAHIIMSAPQPSESPDISLSISCARLDFQVSAMAQICNGLLGTSTSTGAGTGIAAGAATTSPLSVIEELMLGFHPGELPEEQRDEDPVDNALWRGLLASFQHARTLRVHAALAADLSRALQPADRQAILDEDLAPEPEPPLLFPELRSIVLLHGGDEGVLAAASKALSVFVDGRNRAGHPVQVEARDLNRLSSTSQPVISSSSSMRPRPGTRRTRHVGQGGIINGSS